jgi:hypothetical protein
MACHHGSSCKQICHHAGQVINAVSSSAVSSNENSIWINHFHDLKAIDDGFKKIRYVIFPPHIRSFLRRPWHKPDGPRRNELIIQVFMIVPLLLIDLKGAASSSMEAKDKTIAVSGFLSVNKVVEPHLESIMVMINDFLS